MPFTGKADRITLQMADQHSDGDHQQQSINPLRIPQSTALELEDSRFLIAEQLLATEAVAVGPDQIEAGIEVADQIQGRLKVCPPSRPGACQHRFRSVDLAAADTRHRFRRSRSAGIA